MDKYPTTQSTGLHIQKAYISLGTSSMQILLSSAHHVSGPIFNEQATKEFGVRIVAGST